MKKIFGLIGFLLLAMNVFGQATWIRGEKIEFETPFAQAIQKTNEDGGVYYRYVHFGSPLNDFDKRKLQGSGFYFLDYLSNNTYLVGLQEKIPTELCDALGIDGIALISAASKISPKMKERPIPSWAQAGNKVKVILMGYEQTDPSTFESWLRLKEIQIDFVAKREPYAEVTILESQIESLNQEGIIAFMDWIMPPAVKDDVIGRGMHRSSLLDASYSSGRHYDGTGVNVLVRDDGAIGPHIDFEGRLEQDDWDIYSGDDHGDMVSGILCGAGNIDPTKKGMASGASLHVRPYNANFLQYTMDLHQNDNVVVTSTSYSNGCNTGYTASTRTIDKQLYENPTLMHVFSAGNMGTSNCDYGVLGWGNITGGHKQAKNCIAVANLKNDMTLATSSSRGPAYDGRIKPDLAAFGQGQKSTGSKNKYITGGGTSAAAPGVAGVFTQLIHAYKDINNAEPDAALIKACLLNGANDLGNKGPDFQFGWGAVNGYRAVEIIEKGQYQSGNMSQGGTKFHSITVPNNNTQVRFMLYWADPKAAVSATSALINDLNIKVEKPDGTTVLPWVLNPAPNMVTINAPATHGVDSLNNVEQVSFLAQAGTYDIIVTGASVPMGPQKYYLVYSLIEEPLFMAYPNGGEHFAPGDEVQLFWDTYRESSSSFKIEISYDDGVTWTQIGSTYQQYYIWTVGNQISSTVKLRIKQDGFSTQSAEHFTIFPKPDGLLLDTMCVDRAVLRWGAVPNATSYDIYTLGDKYMEVIGSSVDSFWYMPITNPLDSFWYAVSAKGANGLQSERAVAKFYSGGLKNCQAAFDLSVQIEEKEVFIDVCAEIQLPVKITIQNNGTTVMSNFNILYSVNGAGVVSTPFGGSIAVGETIPWQSANPIVMTNTGTYKLEVWIQSNVDQIASNNLASTLYHISNHSLVTKTEFIEGFAGAEFPPAGWLISGKLGGYSWLKKGVPGPFDNVSEVIMVDNFEFDTNTPVTIQSEVINTDGDVLYLSFDYAYTSYDATYIDSLKVTVVDVCSNDQKVVFLKGGEDLKTIADFVETAWEPESAADWKHVFIPIKGFNDGFVTVRFSNINGFSNNLYVDNINLKTGRINNLTQLCAGELTTFSTDILANNYEWKFEGTEANGIGPHSISFDSPGEKEVRLILDFGVGVDTIYKTILVLSEPVASFNYVNGGSSIQFNNASEYSVSNVWDFGDGATSMEENPTHTFADGTYSPCLMVQNDCGADTICQTILVTSMNDIKNIFRGIQLAPNPTSDFFNLSNSGDTQYLFDASLLNLVGQVVLPIGIVDLKRGTQKTIDVNHLPAGVYWLKLIESGKVAYAKIVIR